MELPKSKQTNEQKVLERYNNYGFDKKPSKEECISKLQEYLQLFDIINTYNTDMPDQNEIKEIEEYIINIKDIVIMKEVLNKICTNKDMNNVNTIKDDFIKNANKIIPK
jgi:hypothetical protein